MKLKSSDTELFLICSPQFIDMVYFLQMDSFSLGLIGQFDHHYYYYIKINHVYDSMGYCIRAFVLRTGSL